VPPDRTPLRRLVTRLLPGRSLAEVEALLPELATGLRAAVATVVPLVLATSGVRPELSWMALGGWLGTLVDPGGARASRARASALFAIVGATVIVVVEVSDRVALLAPFVLGALAFACSMLRVLGAAASTLGTMLTVVAALGSGRSSPAPLRDAAFFALGGILAVVLSSIVWPIWSHLPVRRALAGVFAALEAYVVALAETVRAGAGEGDAAWGSLGRDHPRLVREAIESARSMSLAVHARRTGETATGSNLRVLLGMAEGQFLVVVTLAAELEALPVNGARARTGESAAATLEGLARTYQGVRDILVADTWAQRPDPTGTPSGASPEHVAALLDELAAESSVALALADSLALVGASTRARVAAEPPFEPPPAVAWLLHVRDALTPRSPVFHHALRVALAAVVAAALGAWLSPAHTAWVTVTAVVVLQPHTGATLRRAIERVIGTTLGGLVAAAITLARPGPFALAALMFPLSIAAVVTRPRSYRLFTFFLTPVFVLVAMRASGDPWVAAVRAADTLLGGVVALVAVVLVFPRWEARVGLPDALAAMAREVLAYAARVEARDAAPAGGDAALLVEVDATRRAAAAAIRDAEASVERLLGDPLRRGAVEPSAVERISYARRVVLAATTLDTLVARGGARGEGPRAGADARLRRFLRLYRQAVDGPRAG
jgi:uncharacterized membrane protein YccC